MRDALAEFGLDGLLLVRQSKPPAALPAGHRTATQAAGPPRRERLMSTLESLAVRWRRIEPRAFMDASEIREMASVGLNSVTTRTPIPISPNWVSTTCVARSLMRPSAYGNSPARLPEHFAYPYGKFDQRVRNEVQALGVRSACTTRLGLVQRDADPFALNRVNMCSPVAGREPLFAARILGF